MRELRERGATSAQYTWKHLDLDNRKRSVRELRELGEGEEGRREVAAHVRLGPEDPPRDDGVGADLRGTV